MSARPPVQDDIPPLIALQTLRGFAGPSRAAPWRCLEIALRCRSASVDAHTLEALTAAARAALPSLPAHALVDSTASSLEELADLAGRIIIGLHLEVFPCTPRLMVSSAGSELRLVVGCADAEAATEAARTAVAWVNDTLGASDGAAHLAAFREKFSRVRPGLEDRRVLEEAVRRGIPWNRQGNALRLGWGSSLRWYRSIMTDRTPAFSFTWASRKPVAADMMGRAGIPVPIHPIAADARMAVRIAERIGYPVVMKPADSDRGVGVRLGLTSAEEVRQAFDEVRTFGAVVVQPQHAGADYRLLVIAGRLVAAAQRSPARVFGDGQRSVQALIEAVNRDPRRGVHHTTVLERITVDDEVLRTLRSQGLTLDDVPATGREVRLRMTANLSTGGDSEDVTARVHPDNRALAERAARIIGLDIAGIDFLCPDISRSHLEVGGVVCEINPNPGFRPHLAAPGSPDVARAVVDALFPQGDGRIPAALITGTIGKTTTCRMVASILRAAGHTVGLSTTDGVQVDDARVREGDEAGPRGATMVLSDPAVTAAVLETARGGILRFGIGPDRYRVGAVLNVGTDHVGSDGVKTADDMARLKSLVLAGATHAWVLNGDDPRCLAMARNAGDREVILVGRTAQSPPLARHLADGGRAVVLCGEGEAARVVALRGREELVSIAVRRIPATFDGAAEFNADNARYATAIALAMDTDADAITAGLTRFAPDGRWSSARANLHHAGGVSVLLDFAHNVESFDAIGRFAMRLAVNGRRVIVIDAPGDRTDAALRDMATATLGRFDQFICTTSLARGRPPGQIARLLAQALTEQGAASECIDEVEPFEDALALALNTARPGDLLVIPVDQPRQVLEHPAYRRLAEGSTPAT